MTILGWSPEPHPLNPAQNQERHDSWEPDPRGFAGQNSKCVAGEEVPNADRRDSDGTKREEVAGCIERREKCDA